MMRLFANINFSGYRWFVLNFEPTANTASQDRVPLGQLKGGMMSETISQLSFYNVYESALMSRDGKLILALRNIIDQRTDDNGRHIHINAIFEADDNTENFNLLHKLLLAYHSSLEKFSEWFNALFYATISELMFDVADLQRGLQVLERTSIVVTRGIGGISYKPNGNHLYMMCSEWEVGSISSQLPLSKTEVSRALRKPIECDKMWLGKTSGESNEEERIVIIPPPQPHPNLWTRIKQWANKMWGSYKREIILFTAGVVTGIILTCMFK